MPISASDSSIPLGHADLGLDQVPPGDDLGDRVLHLDARVHLDEVVGPIGPHQELDRARVGVGGLPRHLQRVLGQPRAQRLRQRPGGRVLDDLLVAALNGAVAFEQVDQVAVLVAQHLHLDVLGANHQLLDEHRVVAERLARLGLRARDRLLELRLGSHHAHAAPAAAACRLDEHGVAHLGREGPCVIHAVDGLGRAGHHRHPRLLGDLASGDLVAQRVDGLGRGADELDAGVAALARERGPLGQQPIPRVDGVDLVVLGQRHDLVLGQVGRHRIQPPAHQVRLVRLVAVQVDPVLLREDRDGPDAELGAGAEHANGDLATVGAHHAAKASGVMGRLICADEARSVKARGPCGDNGRSSRREADAQPARNWKSRSRTTTGSITSTRKARPSPTMPL